MIKIELNEKEYTLPTNFSEVMLCDYIDITKIDEKITDIERTVKIISILSKLKEEEVRKISLNNIKVINKNLLFLFQNSDNILVENYKIDGVDYGFNKDLDKLSFGEYIDLEQFTSKELKLDYLMAILYRPVKRKRRSKGLGKMIDFYIYNKKKFDIEEYDMVSIKERAELFSKNMSVDVVLGAMFFFLILRLLYMENMEKSMEKKEMTNWVMKKMEAFGVIFKEDGVL